MIWVISHNVLQNILRPSDIASHVGSHWPHCRCRTVQERVQTRCSPSWSTELHLNGGGATESRLCLCAVAFMQKKTCAIFVYEFFDCLYRQKQSLSPAAQQINSPMKFWPIKQHLVPCKTEVLPRDGGKDGVSVGDGRQEWKTMSLFINLALALRHWSGWF